MLCYELARFIDEEYHSPIYPAVAAIADRCEIKEVDMLIGNSGMNRADLKDIGIVMDYLSHNLRFDSGDGLYTELIKDSKVVSVIASEVHKKFDATLERLKAVVEPEKVGDVWFMELNLDNQTQRGKYPTAGKVLSMAHDHVVDLKQEDRPILSIGYFSDGIIIRATHPILPVPTLLKDLQKQFPLANVDGGGHEQAGSIKYMEPYGDKIRDYIRNALKTYTHTE
jgi:RecJ-like exonuclease